MLKIIQDSEAVGPAGRALGRYRRSARSRGRGRSALDRRGSDQARRAGPDRRLGRLTVRGKVVRVDPAGFLKVSALGIEEQRVRVTIDFVDPPEAWSRLGHDYRVIVHVTIWSADDALTVPVSALFRKGEDWAVFAVDDGVRV